MNKNTDQLKKWIPLLKKDDSSEEEIIQTNRLALSHVYMKHKWHPAPVHNFTVPLWFQGVYDEQRAARQHAAIFDRSHLGRFYVVGEKSSEILDTVFATSVKDIPEGQLKRVLVAHPNGVVLDIPTVFHLSHGRWLVISGPKTQSHLLGMVGEIVDENALENDVIISDRISDSVLFSVQGPESEKLLEGVLGITIPKSVPFGEVHEILLGGYRALIARISQINENGYWFLLSPEVGEHFFDNAVTMGITPAGLAAHDALRIEAGFLEAPYETPSPVTPLEANLQELVDFRDRDFPGFETLLNNKENIPERLIRGIKITGQGIAKRGDRIFSENVDIGALVNAAYSAQLSAGIGLAYLPPNLHEVSVKISGQQVTAEVINLPFYKLSLIHI